MKCLRKGVNNILRFLGCGAAFYPTLGNTSAYYEKNNNLYLIDCGEMIFYKLYERNMLAKYNRIYVIITHMHADHVGSLGSLISYTYFVLGKKIVVIHPNIILQELLDLTGIDRKAYIMKVCEETEIDGVTIKAIPVKHAENMDCYGYIISDCEETIYYSGDSYEIPEKVLEAFFKGEICEIFQDTTDKVSVHPSHFPLTELAELIPVGFRKRVFCMHFSSDFSELIYKLGFSDVTKLAEL